MEEYYIKSLQKIKDLGQVLDYTEWNKIAKKRGVFVSREFTIHLREKDKEVVQKSHKKW